MKDYDGERREVSNFDSPRYHGKRHPKTHNSTTDIDEDIDHLIKKTLEVDAHAKVIGMAWKERISPFRQGTFSGVVDKKMRPHGRGSWKVIGSMDEKLAGYWYNGS